MVENAPRVVGGLPVSMRVALSASEVICFGLRKRKHSNILWILRGSKARLVSNEELVLHGRMSGMSCRYILAISDGETESTLSGTVNGEGLGCLGGGDSEGAGLGYSVGGWAGIRSSTLYRDKGFLVRQALAGRGSE